MEPKVRLAGSSSFENIALTATPGPHPEAGAVASRQRATEGQAPKFCVEALPNGGATPPPPLQARRSGTQNTETCRPWCPRGPIGPLTEVDCTKVLSAPSGSSTVLRLYARAELTPARATRVCGACRGLALSFGPDGRWTDVAVGRPLRTR
jgi:hypothetical protein